MTISLRASSLTKTLPLPCYITATVVIHFKFSGNQETACIAYFLNFHLKVKLLQHKHRVSQHYSFLNAHPRVLAQTASLLLTFTALNNQHANLC